MMRSRNRAGFTTFSTETACLVDSAFLASDAAPPVAAVRRY
jgi:hypothetical protein